MREPTEREKAKVKKLFKEQPADEAWDKRPSKKTALGRIVEEGIMPKDKGGKKK
jgi:hypothetical protein